MALTYLLSGLATIHAGELSDRVGFRRSLVASMVIAAAGFLWVALLAHTLTMLVVGLVVAGAGLTLVGPAAKVLVADHVRPERHGIAFGVHNVRHSPGAAAGRAGRCRWWAGRCPARTGRRDGAGCSWGPRPWPRPGC